MNPFALFKPEYLFRPSQIARRVRVAFLPRKTARLEVPLAFGGAIEVWPEDVIGQAILHLGVYDLAVSEVVWRLTQPGEIVIDIGANIGYFTRLFGTRVGAAGRVIAFEAHPALVGELRSNVARHPVDEPQVFDVRHAAVSSHCGSVQLAVPRNFATNRGLCHVVENSDTSGHVSTIDVASVRLDDLIDPSLPVGVVKMDVEGHEPSVLAGAQRLLRSKQVRDWVFEELTGHSGVVQTFEALGYKVYLVERHFRRIVLAGCRNVNLNGRWEPPSFLATSDGPRALRLCEEAGWQILCSRLEN